MNIKLKSIHNDLKSTKKHAKSPNDRQSLMLKMATSYSIFLLIILILFFYLYVSASKNAREQYQWQAKSTLMSNVELFEKDLNIMNVYCRQLLQNDNFRNLVNMTETDDRFYDLGYSMATTLSTDVYPESLLPISEVFCYLPNTGYVLAPSSFISQDRYYNWIKRYSPDLQEEWVKALTLSSNYYRFIPLDKYAPNSSKDYFLYMIDINDLYYMNAEAVVCFVLEKNELSALFDCLKNNIDYEYLSIYAETNDKILSISNEKSANFDTMISDGLLDEIHKFLDSSDVSIGSYTSNNSGYTYYFTYPSYESTTNFARPQILYLVLFAAALVGGIGFILLLSKKNVEPIIELDQELQVAKLEKSNLLEEKSHLEEVMDTQRPLICNSYVRKLLKGMIVSEEEASYAKEFLGLADTGLIYNGLYVIAYNNVNEEQPSSESMRTPQECNTIVLDTLKEYLGDKFYYYSPSDRTYALMVVGGAEDEQNLIIKANEMIVHMHDYLLDNYDIWLFAGIGKNTDDIMNVWESYQQAVEAVNYTSKNYIFYPYEFIKKDSSAFYYPTELSTKLIRFITTGNKPQVLELFNLLHQENIEERSLPINMLQFLLSDIRNTLLKARFALPASTSKDAIKALDECFDQHVSFKLCEDVALKLCSLFTASSDDSNIVTAIEKYIKNNYTDPSMGLNKISDEFQISESYFSHMFKEKTGVNFSTYLENIRLNEASRLIRETDISLNELYISVGYNNANTFRRAFKKVYGVTPSTMRDSK